MKLYTTPTCGRCKVLKEKLNNKGISYQEIQDADVLVERGIKFVPVLEVEDKLLNFMEANTYINNL